MANETPTTNAAKAGTIVDMGSGDAKDSVTGKSKGNKKKGAKPEVITADQLKKLLDDQYNRYTTFHVAESSIFASRVMDAAEKSGNKAFADAMRGSEPTTLLGKFKAHAHRSVTFGDFYFVVAGGVVLYVIYNGLAYAFRNKVVFPFAREFKTGIEADRRSAGIGGGSQKPRIQMPSARA